MSYDVLWSKFNLKRFLVRNANERLSSGTSEHKGGLNLTNWCWVAELSILDVAQLQLLGVKFNSGNTLRQPFTKLKPFIMIEEVHSSGTRNVYEILTFQDTSWSCAMETSPGMQVADENYLSCGYSIVTCCLEITPDNVLPIQFEMTWVFKSKNQKNLAQIKPECKSLFVEPMISLRLYGQSCCFSWTPLQLLSEV